MKKRKTWSVALLQPMLMIGTRVLAHAAGGTGLPWDQPMMTVSNALWGVPSHAIVTATIVFAGLAWAFTDHAIGARRVFASAMGGALA